MERSIVLFGALTFAHRKSVQAWKGKVADPAAYRDWKGVLRCTESESRTVTELLARFDSFASERFPPGRLELGIRGVQASIAGFLDDDGTRDFGPLVLTLFRTAADVGGTGSIWAIQPQGAFGFELRVEPQVSRLSALPETGLEDLLEAPLARRARALLEQRLPELERTAFDALVAQRAMLESSAAAYDELVDRIARLPGARLLRAAKDLERAGLGQVTLDHATGRPTSQVTGRRDLVRLTELWPNASELLSGLRAGGNVDVRAAAVRLAARAAPDGQESVAALLRAKPDAAVVKVAAEELTQANHPGVTRVLVEIAREPPPGATGFAVAAAAALAAAASGGAPAVKELTLLLTPALVERDEPPELALVLVDLLLRARQKSDPARLVELWARAKNPHVRERLYRAIATSKDRELLDLAIARARSEAERKDLTIARLRAKSTKKAAKTTPPKRAGRRA